MLETSKALFNIKKNIYNIYNIYMVYIILNFIIKNNKDNNGQSAGNQSIYERKYMSRILRDYT